MPMAAMRPCAYPGCPELVHSGRCAQHTTERRREENRRYHASPAIKRLYNSHYWQVRREAQLAREPWCAECLRHGVYTPATDVDHIEPHEGDPIKFFNGALQSLCHADHSSKTATEVFHQGEGGQKVSPRGAQNGRGLPCEKNSQCGESA